MSCLTIETVIGREIMDSRGNPTVEAEVVLAGGAIGEVRRRAAHRPANLKRWSCATEMRIDIWAKV